MARTPLDGGPRESNRVILEVIMHLVLCSTPEKLCKKFLVIFLLQKLQKFSNRKFDAIL